VDFEPVTPDVEIPVRTVTIGWFTGSAFTFYYPDNLEALEQSGAKLIPIDPVSDKELPDMDALYIGGGFPETHGTLLAGNKPFKQMLRAACQAGLPVWAECGGLMYLAQELIWDESRYEMAGVLPVSVAMNPKPQGHGYMETTVDAPNPFFPVGTRIKGHEFHYSRIITSKDITTVLAVERGTGIGGHRDGIVTGNVVANYVHIHAAATPEWTAGLIAAATNYHNYKHCL